MAIFRQNLSSYSFDILIKLKNTCVTILEKKLENHGKRRNILLRQIAANLEVDTALISKLEKGYRNPTKVQIMKIADFFNLQIYELLTLCLAKKLASLVAIDQNLASNTMNFVKNKIRTKKE